MKKYDLVESWINNVAYSHKKNPNTEYSYKLGLSDFCEFVETSPEEIMKQYDQMDEKDFRRKYAQYLKAFISGLTKEKLTVTTIGAKVCAVKSFFKYNDLPLGFIPVGRNFVTYHNRDISKEEIIAILKVSKPREKAFYCMMAQSGLRPETLCELQIKHVQPDLDNGTIPALITVPREITKGAYGEHISFMGEESVRYLKDYLTSRKKTAPNDLLYMSHGEEKSLNPKSVSQIFKNTIIHLKSKGKVDFEQKVKGKPRNVRLYNLRKYFRKYANQAGSENYEYWMGHTVKGVDAHYRPQDPEFYRKIYAEKAMPFLRIEEPTPNETEIIITNLQKQIAEKDERLKALEEFQKQTLAQIHELAAIKDQLKYYKEGNAVVISLEKLSKEDIKELIDEAQKKSESS